MMSICVPCVHVHMCSYDCYVCMYVCIATHVHLYMCVCVSVLYVMCTCMNVCVVQLGSLTWPVNCNCTDVISFFAIANKNGLTPLVYILYLQVI